MIKRLLICIAYWGNFKLSELHYRDGTHKGWILVPLSVPFGTEYEPKDLK